MSTIVPYIFFFFFFSSRRRHTRSKRDWSSDVCSSDLIFSVIRRVIERVLDKKLRSQIVINRNQRGFVAGIQGCHINSILVNACLQKAKTTKTDSVAVFLDVSKAYDRIGHAHIARCLNQQGVSRNLSRLIMSLLRDSFTRIQVGKDQRSAPIYFKCGVPQGCPLSPILFDLAVNFLYDDLCSPPFANQNGYPLVEGFDRLCITGFADDNAVTSLNVEGARRTVQLTQSLLEKIGLSIN